MYGTDNQDPILESLLSTESDGDRNENGTQNYDAEFGKALGGTTTAETKSGATHSMAAVIHDLDPVDPAKNPFTGSP